MKELVAALIKAQSEFSPIKKETVNPFFHSKYANLESVIEGTKQALRGNGLAVVQTFGVLEGKSVLETILYHTSGQFIKGCQLMDINSADPQKLASASTYARRYGYMAILGIAAEDDDGSGAQDRDKKDPPKQEKKTDTTTVEQCICAEELPTWAAGTIAPQVTGKLTGITERKVGATKDKDITDYIVGGIKIMVWGKKCEAVNVGDDVYFAKVKIDLYQGAKTYLAASIDKEIPFGE